MRRIALFILPLLLLLWAAPTALLSSDTLDLGDFTVPSVKVTDIIPTFEEDGSLNLTAKLNRSIKSPCRITWRFTGENHGYAFDDAEGFSASLSIGNPQARVTIEACIAEGDRSGGCRSITLNADLLDSTQDETAWMQIHVPDFSEQNFICQVLEDDQYQYVFYDVASRVSAITGEYLTDTEDLAVKVPGGTLSVHRFYQAGQWTWDHERHDLTLTRGPDGTLSRIIKGTVPYRPDPRDRGSFTDGFYQIRSTDTGFRWESKDGAWKRYNPEGKLTAFGDRNGVIGRILFRHGRVASISDRNNQLVFSFDTDEEGRVRAAYARDGRAVTYRYRGGKLSAATDVLGKETQFAYDGKGRLETVKRPEGAVTRIAYHDSGRVASVLDTNGEGHRFAWDYDQKLSLYYARIEDPLGKVTEIWSNQKGQARRVDVNRRTVHAIEKQGNTLIVTDARGLVTRKTFDDHRNLLEIVYPDGSRVTRQYDPRFNRRVEESNENGVVTRWSYDDTGRLVKKVEAAGLPEERITEYVHDDDGNLLTLRRVGDDHTPEAVTRYTYDAAGNRTSVTDPEGNTATTTYDAMGNVLTQTDPTGAVKRFVYDHAGRMVETHDPLGHTTRFVYDVEGRKLREIDPMGSQTRYAYDDPGNLVSRTDALGNVARFEYNAANQVIREIDPEGREVHHAYDTQGRRISTMDRAGNETRMEYETESTSGCASCGAAGDNQPARIIYPTFTKEFAYDARGRKIQETDVLTETEAYVTLFEHDPVGNLISKTDKEGHTTRTAYDALNRLVRVIDALGNETAYAYDSRDNLIALTDGNGNTTRFVHDRNNRMVKETRPMGQETTYTYDGAGNLQEKIDAKGQRAVHEVDATGRLVAIRYYESPEATAPVKTVSFTFDPAGNLLSYEDGATSGQYIYDALHRKTQETVDYGAFAKSFRYAYLKNGLKAGFTGPDEGSHAYTYDGAGRLAAMEIPGLGTITYGDYLWNRPTRIALPGGTTRAFAYDPLMRIQRIASKGPQGETILDYQYTYDRMGNILTKETEHGTYRYTYDALYQLTGADNPTLPDEAFTYDPVGNRLTSADTENPWVYNANNELLRYNGVTFGYDANGSTVEQATTSGVSRYGYNLENRLSRVEDGQENLIASYAYDPFGRRLWKEVGGERIYFMYSDEGLIAELDPKGKEVTTYGYVPGSTWTTDPVFMRQNRQYYLYHNDHLGTPHKITSMVDEIAWIARYSSFGEAHISGAKKFKNSLRFPGHYQDYETNENYNYNRFYMSYNGRYNRPDPLGLETINHNINFIIKSSDANQYLYVHNSPINSVDYLGLEPGVGKDCPGGQYSCPKKNPPQPIVNGCGPSGWKSLVVPNEPIGGYINFRPACNIHDICYNICNKPRQKCDKEFYVNLFYACHNKWGIEINIIPPSFIPIHLVNDINPFYQACLIFAETYYHAVKIAGEKPYKDSQNSSCYCSTCSCIQ